MSGCPSEDYYCRASAMQVILTCTAACTCSDVYVCMHVSLYLRHTRDCYSPVKYLRFSFSANLRKKGWVPKELHYEFHYSTQTCRDVGDARMYGFPESLSVNECHYSMFETLTIYFDVQPDLPRRSLMNPGGIRES